MALDFDPTTQSLHTYQAGILRTSEKKNGLVFEAKKNATSTFGEEKSSSFSHYLGKFCRHLFRPCTKMEKVWNEMARVGIREIEVKSELPNELKYSKLLCLKDNLEFFEASVIKSHNERRRGLFKNARSVKADPKEYERLDRMIAECKIEIYRAKVAYLSSEEKTQIEALKCLSPDELNALIRGLNSPDSIENFAYSLDVVNVFNATQELDEHVKNGLSILARAKEYGIESSNAAPNWETIDTQITYETPKANFYRVKVGTETEYQVFDPDYGDSKNLSMNELIKRAKTQPNGKITLPSEGEAKINHRGEIIGLHTVKDVNDLIADWKAFHIANPIDEFDDKK